MRRMLTTICFFCAALITILTPFAANAQRSLVFDLPYPVPASMSPWNKSDDDQLARENFSIVEHVNQLPQSVQNDFCYEPGYSEIADPGEFYNATDVDTLTPPNQRLLYAAVSAHYCIVYAERGSRGSPEPWFTLHRLQEHTAEKIEPANSRVLPPAVAAQVEAASHTDQLVTDLANAEKLPPIFAAITKADKKHLLSDSFAVVKVFSAIPKSVQVKLLGKSALQGIADAGKPFYAADALSPALPMRRLIYAGVSPNSCIVYYVSGRSIGGYSDQFACYHYTRLRAELVWKSQRDMYWPNGELFTIAQIRHIMATSKYYSITSEG